jgi:hypothetical protein
MPLSWHTKKTDAYTPSTGAVLDTSRIQNFIINPKFDDHSQPKQMRGGYVTTSGMVLKPRKSLRMKTAIDPETGRAKDSQLFGYESITSGQCFTAELSADDDFDQSLFDRVVDTFNGEILIGRSRATEYGRVNCTVSPLTHRLDSPSDDQTLTLWLLADLALQDEHGQPVLVPEAGYLGLKNAEWLPEQSFIRTRSYSPYNSHYRAYDLERPVISQGSVLRYRLNAPLTEAQTSQLAKGLGAWRQAGLGAVWVNPPMLQHDTPEFSDCVVADNTATSISKPASPLISWLEEQNRQDGTQGADRRKAYDYANQLADLYKNSARLAGNPEFLVGPGKSQWGRVLGLSKQSPSQNELYKKLIKAEDRICKGKEDWEAETAHENERLTFHDWLEKIVSNKKINDTCFVLGIIAKQAQNLIDREYGA